MAESGQLGVISEPDVQRHMQWIRNIMELLHMLPGLPASGKPPTLYSQVHITYAPCDGEWKTELGNPSITKHSLLGTITTQHTTQKFIAQNNGQLVWWHQTGAVAKGEEIAVLAYEHDIIVP